MNHFCSSYLAVFFLLKKEWCLLLTQWMMILLSKYVFNVPTTRPTSIYQKSLTTAECWNPAMQGTLLFWGFLCHCFCFLTFQLLSLQVHAHCFVSPVSSFNNCAHKPFYLSFLPVRTCRGAENQNAQKPVCFFSSAWLYKPRLKTFLRNLWD